MNFLELVEAAHREGGVAGRAPTSVDNQTGMAAKLVAWVSNAWIDIQAMHDGGWKFLRKKDTRTLTVNKREYELVGELNLPNVRKLDKALCFIRDPLGSRWPLEVVEFDEFERRYAAFSPGRPTVCTITPDFTVAFNATPDQAYTVDFNYWMTGEKLADATDVPSIPEDHHMVIVWKSLVRYASHEGASQVRADVMGEYASALRRLEVNQLQMPEQIRGRPLA